MKTPVDYTPEGSRLTFVKQTVFAVGNYQRIKDRLKQIKAKAIYLCSCGNSFEAAITLVKSGHTKSCGCYLKDYPANYKHGMAGTPLYNVWASMIQRCEDPNHEAFHLYGGSGVFVCHEWRRDFTTFYNWAIANGWKKGLEIDKDTKGGAIYSPENCLLVTKKQNCNKRRNNKVLVFNGVSKTMSEWSDESGIHQDNIYNRLKLGWSVERTITEPVKITAKRKV